MNELINDLREENEQLKLALEKAEAERDKLIKTCLNSKVVDLVRCGIGGNYGGACYDDALAKYHAPLEQLRKELE